MTISTLSAPDIFPLSKRGGFGADTGAVLVSGGSETARRDSAASFFPRRLRETAATAWMRGLVLPSAFTKGSVESPSN